MTARFRDPEPAPYISQREGVEAAAMITNRACACCNGTGIVPDAVGDPRPCSRCQSTRFDRWADRRRPCGPIEWGKRLKGGDNDQRA